MPNKEYLSKALEIANLRDREKDARSNFERGKSVIEDTYKIQLQNLKKEFDGEIQEINGFIQESEREGKEFLDDGFYLRLGDIIDELAKILGIPESAFQFDIELEYREKGEHSIEEMISLVKSTPVFNKEVKITLQGNNYHVDFPGIYRTIIKYSMNYNMPQADNISFVDHFYSETRYNFLDKSEYTMFVSNPDYEHLLDILVPIPYRYLAKDLGYYFDEQGQFRFSVKFPYDESTRSEDVFRTCIINCAKKRDFGPIRKRDKKEEIN